MKHILVPIGSNENSTNTLQYAIDFAKIAEAKVFVFRAYKASTKAGVIKNIDNFLERETKLYLQSVVRNVDTKSVDVKLISAKGSLLDSIVSIHSELRIDLIITGPKSNSQREEVFLGNTSGSIVKQTEIPVLIVPEGYSFSKINKVLTAFKSGVVNKEGILNPLQKVLSIFGAKNNLLLVKTPNHSKEDLILNADLDALKDELLIAENATTFQGVLTHLITEKPDLLCVFRRKRGFFTKLWERNTILKKEFSCTIPLLVLRGKI